MCRQRERRPDILDVIRKRGYGRVLDYSAEEQNRKYFEGTGSLVIDRINGVAYVALSERANRDLAERWAADMGYSVRPPPPPLHSKQAHQTYQKVLLSLQHLIQKTAY